MLKRVAIFVLLSLVTVDVEGMFQDVSRRCRVQFEFFRAALETRRDWALDCKMIFTVLEFTSSKRILLVYDTWGKIQYGLRNGNVNNFGDFDRCLSFEKVISGSLAVNQEVGTIKGKHCMVSYDGIDLDERKWCLTTDCPDWRTL